MPRSSSPPPKRDDILWKLHFAGFIESTWDVWECNLYFWTLKSVSLRRHQSAHSAMVLKACLVIDSSAWWISGTSRRARLGASGAPTEPPTPGRPPAGTV